MTKKLTGKVAIVTGASRGIGREIAEELAQNGAKVVINYNSNPGKAEELVQVLKQKGSEAIAVQADVGKVADIERLFQQTLDQFGQVDILINNAGLGIMKPIGQITEEDFDKIYAINVKGTYFACQQAAMHMNNKGRIINFSTSVVGMMIANYSLYASTKGAVEQITRQLAKEFGPQGISINAVAPGPVDTEFFTAEKTEQQIDMFRKMAAFNRLGEPSDIASVVSFLASEESGWITGQTIRINGGTV